MDKVRKPSNSEKAEGIAELYFHSELNRKYKATNMYEEFSEP
jgi:hypothetical protein